MYKDRGGKLVMGPLWDFKLTLGLADYLEGWKAEGWYYDQPAPGNHCAMTCADLRNTGLVCSIATRSNF